MKKTDIVITVCLDKNRVPEKMSWSAKDGGVSNQETKAFLFCLSLSLKTYFQYVNQHGKVPLVFGERLC